ncbi:hypothetical protein ACFX2I_011583 [Malus domestica]
MEGLLIPMPDDNWRKETARVKYRSEESAEHNTHKCSNHLRSSKYPQLPESTKEKTDIYSIRSGSNGTDSKRAENSGSSKLAEYGGSKESPKRWHRFANRKLGVPREPTQWIVNVNNPFTTNHGGSLQPQFMEMINKFARNSSVTLEEIPGVARSQHTGSHLVGYREDKNLRHYTEHGEADCSTTKRGAEDGDSELNQTSLKKCKPTRAVKISRDNSRGGGGWPSTAARTS